ncbi:MAG: acyltransferase [Blautia sp.]|nr:acyltransferase [Blautia sp.]MCM1200909.1 acyltransferase [Bacteroides fragilis]
MFVSNDRKIEYEKIRVCAMFFMVAHHCRGPLSGFIDTAGEQYLDDGLTLLLATCNSLFFMLSGKFALASKCGTLSDYYRYYMKKLINIMAPILIYLFLRSLFEYGGRFWEISFWKTYIRNVCYDYAGTEYWFLYTLAGMLLLAPFLNKMVANFQKGEMWLFVGIGLLYNTVCSYAPYVNLYISWQYIFGGWVFYFMLGYFLEKIIDTPKKENIVIMAGGICFIISMIQKQFGLVSNIYDLAPTFTLISCAVFFLLKREYCERELFFRLILKAGRYSFAIYLVHNPVRRFLAEHIPFLSGKAYLLNLLELAVCTIGVSFVLAFICENTVIRAVQWGIRKIVYPQERKKQVLQ